MANNLWIGTTTVYSTAGNWTLGAAPVNTNAVYLSSQYSIFDMLSGLAQSAVTLASFNMDMSYTGLIGTARSGGTATTYLDTGATTFNIGTPTANGTGNGSRRINITGSNSGAVFNILGTGSTANDTGATPCLLICTAAVLNCSGGSTGVSLYPGETASVATLNMTAGSGTPSVLLGSGCTLTTGNVYAGTLTNNSAAASTVIVRATGALVHGGTGGYTALTLGAQTTCFYNGTGTITALNINGAGTLDMSGGTGAVTVTNATLLAGAKIIDPAKRLTFTNPITLSGCRATDVSLNTGYSRTVQFA